MKLFPPHVKWVQLETPADKENEAPESTSTAMLRGIKGLIFDFDGTLFDNKYIGLFLVMACPTDGLRLWRERFVRHRFAGSDYNTPDEYFSHFFYELGKISLRTPEKMKSWYFNRYMPRMVRVLRRHYRARPGADELFRRANNPKSKINIAIYSDYPFLKERLEAIGLFPSENIRLYGPESFGAQKPAVRPFHKIAKDFGITPEETLVIGDREDTDGLGAFNAKMRFFCLETGNRRYFRMDPNRRRPKKGETHGPLLMYAGRWNKLCKLLLENFF
jgi:FMN phosphatase YigB (HAD superfamily)